MMASAWPRQRRVIGGPRISTCRSLEAIVYSRSSSRKVNSWCFGCSILFIQGQHGNSLLGLKCVLVMLSSGNPLSTPYGMQPCQGVTHSCAFCVNMPVSPQLHCTDCSACKEGTSCSDHT